MRITSDAKGSVKVINILLALLTLAEIWKMVELFVQVLGCGVRDGTKLATRGVGVSGRSSL